MMAAVAYMAGYISNLVVIGGSHPLEAIMVGVLIGAALRNFGLIPAGLKEGLKKFEVPLLWGVVMLGAGFTPEIAKAEPISLVIIFVTMSVGFWFIYLLGRAGKLPDKLSSLLSVGTTICGGSAIAITGPLIKAKEEEVSYAVTTVTMMGFLALLIYPHIGKLIDMSQTAFGIWAGTAIHNTPLVIGAGYMYGDHAGQVATMVKLTRNIFMIPVALLISLWYGRRKAIEKRMGKKEVLKAFPWFLFGYFVMALFRNLRFFTPAWVVNFVKLGKFLVAVGMAGIGMNTDLRNLKNLGMRPLVVGSLAAVVVALISLSLIGVFSGEIHTPDGMVP